MIDKINNFFDTSFIKFLFYLIGVIYLIILYSKHYYDIGFVLNLTIYSVIYILVVRYLMYLFTTYQKLRFIQDQLNTLNYKEFEIIIDILKNGTIISQEENIDFIINLISKSLLFPIITDDNNDLINKPINLTPNTIKFFNSTQGKNFLDSIKNKLN